MKKGLTRSSAFQVRDGHRLAACDLAKPARRKRQTMRRAAVIALALGQLLVIAPAQAVPGPGAGHRRTEGVPDQPARWRASEGDFASWTRAGTALTDAGELTLDPGTATPGDRPLRPGRLPGRDLLQRRSFLVGQATSPVIATPDGFSEAIASWNADTPAGTWIETLIRARVDGRFTKLYNLGHLGVRLVHRRPALGAGPGRRRRVRRRRHPRARRQAAGRRLRAHLPPVQRRPAAPSPRFARRPWRCPAATTRSASSCPVTRPVGPVLPVPECSQMVYPDGGAD